MNFLYLFVINVAMGLTLAIQVLIHPTFETSTKTMYLISAIVFVNWAVFTWLAYSAAMKEQKLSRGAKASAELPMDDADQRKKALLDVMTAVYLAVILLALICLNVFVFLELTKTAYVAGSL